MEGSVVAGGCDSCGLILGHVRFHPERRGPLSERQDGRGSLYPLGPGSLCFDGLLVGMGSSSAMLG